MTGELADALQDALAAVAASADDVTQATDGGATGYQRGGRTFAVVRGDVVEFRLHPEVAEAAARTAEAGPSSRGTDWVRFAPKELSQHARDRLAAWFLSAWRAAGR